MPFWHSNAPNTFMRFMNEVIQSLLMKFVVVYFHDILVYNNDKKEYLKHIRLLFTVLNAHKLYAKIEN